MVDPPKATKGRRMSKKTRKKSPKKSSKAKSLKTKSPKTSSGKAARTPSVRSAKTPPSKTRRAAANKSAKTANKQTAKTSPAASHQAPSKSLKSAGPRETRETRESVQRTAAGSKATAPARKPSGVKADAFAVGKSALAEGARAPAFRLPRDGGDTVSLSDYSGRKLVLFFYPRADTPGCTKEAIDFTRLKSAFAESQTAILGVSADPLKAQEAFRDKHQLSVPLVSDETHQMLEAYGVWGEKSMYGRSFLGILRTTVLIGEDGRILRIWRNVKVDDHADEVLAAVRAR
jgi:thioredoxin-dependent peroxiredoxin